MLSMHTSPLARLGEGHGGGMNVYVRELAVALARKGAQVDVYTAAADGGENVVDLRSKLSVHHIPIDNSPGRTPEELAKEFAAGVRKHIEASGGVNVIHAHYWLSGLAGHQLKHEMNVPLVTTFHTLERVKAESGVTDIASERGSAEQAVIGCSDVVIASNLIEVADIRRLYNQDARVDIVTPGIDTTIFHTGNKFEARLELGLPVDAPLVLFAGRIQHAKGLDRAVNAFRQVVAMHPDAQLLVIGGPSGHDGNAELKSAQELVLQHQLSENVQFLGAKCRNILATYLRAVDISVVPSRTESFGLIALEAAASGTPVVASARGGLQYVVQHGHTGFLTQDVDELAGAMDHLIANPEKAKKFGETAAERARSFTWDGAATRLLHIYECMGNADLRTCAIS